MKTTRLLLSVLALAVIAASCSTPTGPASEDTASPPTIGGGIG